MALVTANEFCFSHAAHRHAQVRPLHHDRHAERRDLLEDGVGNLVREPLLHLQPAAEHLDEPRNLAQADHLVARNVGDVALAEKRQQMMLAQAVEVDVLDDDHLAVVDGEQRVVDHRVDVRLVSAGEKLERLFDPLRRVDQPLALRILAELRQQPPDQILHRPIVSLHHGCPGQRRRRPTTSTPIARTSPAPGARRTRGAQPLTANPADFDSAWKLARADYWLGGHAPESERRMFYEQGIEAARKAIALDANKPEGHFWVAANMGALAESFGLRAGLKYRKPIKSELETVLRLDPAFQDGSADRALGRWYHKVPRLFGGSHEKAEQHLKAALKYKPDSTVTHYFLAELYADDGRLAEARGRNPGGPRCARRSSMGSRG